MKCMKKIVTMFLLLLPVLCFSQTRPHWLDISNNPVIDVKAYGAKGDGSNDTVAIAAAMSALASAGDGATLVFPSGTYVFNSLLPSAANVVGLGNVILKPYVVGTPIFTLTAKDSWRYGSLTNLKFMGVAGAGIGVKSTSVSAGRMRFEQVTFNGLGTGVDLSYGNIGLTFRNCEFMYCAYGIKLVGSGATSHAGCVLVEQCHFEHNTLAAFYYNDTFPITGQIRLVDCIFEVNYGTSIYLKGFKGINGSIRIESPWFEDYHTHLVASPNIVIDGFSHRASNIVAIDTRLYISDTMVETLIASNSKVILERCSTLANGGGTLVDQFISYDAASQLTWVDYLGHYAGQNFGLVKSYLRSGVSGDTTTDISKIDVMELSLKHKYIPTSSFTDGTIVAAAPCANSSGTLLSAGLVATHTTDGIAAPHSAIWVSDTGFQDIIPDIVASMSPTTPYYAWSVNIKKNTPQGVSHIPLRMSLYTPTRYPGTSRIIAGDTFPTGQWKTIGGVFKSPATSSISLFQYGTLHPSSVGLATASFTIQGFQVVGFTSEAKALDYINSPLIVGEDL